MPQINLTYREVAIVKTGFAEILSELRNQIVTCPDYELYYADIVEIEHKIEAILKLQAKIDQACKPNLEVCI